VKAKRPNFIFLTTDQQRFDTIQCLGAGHMLTPHLNWLVESGIHFSRGYAESPVCVTSRAAMLTGRHFHRMQNVGNWEQKTTEHIEDSLPSRLTHEAIKPTDMVSFTTTRRIVTTVGSTSKRSISTTVNYACSARIACAQWIMVWGKMKWNRPLPPSMKTIPSPGGRLSVVSDF
jgi:hypothetical protein